MRTVIILRPRNIYTEGIQMMKLIKKIFHFIGTMLIITFWAMPLLYVLQMVYFFTLEFIPDSKTILLGISKTMLKFNKTFLIMAYIADDNLRSANIQTK